MTTLIFVWTFGGVLKAIGLSIVIVFSLFMLVLAIREDRKEKLNKKP
jgi:hypothetical protein